MVLSYKHQVERRGIRLLSEYVLELEAAGSGGPLVDLLAKPLSQINEFWVNMLAARLFGTTFRLRLS